MEVKSQQFGPTARDHDVLLALMRGPLTIRQLMRHSCRFEKPFTNYEVLRRRLFKMRIAGLVSQSRYFIPRADRSNYYQLTKKAFRGLAPDVEIPNHSYFDELGFANQNHTFCLHEFYSRLDCDTAAIGCHLLDFTRDRELKLQMGSRIAYPDGSFRLFANGRTRNYLIELDCGTEPVFSGKRRESLSRKIKFYDDYWDQAAERFTVLFVFTNSTARLHHFLQTVHDNIKPPFNRPLFLATMLPDENQQVDFVNDSVFLDHRETALALVGNKISTKPHYATEKILASPVG